MDQMQRLRVGQTVAMLTSGHSSGSLERAIVLELWRRNGRVIAHVRWRHGADTFVPGELLRPT